MRTAVVGMALAVSACGFFRPPCGEVAKAVCTIGDEGEACAALNGVRRSDEPAQRACEDVLPVAKAYAADPAGGRGAWEAAVPKLAVAGYQAKARTISEKLKSFGGAGGRTVEKLEDAHRLADDARAKAAEAVFQNAR